MIYFVGSRSHRFPLLRPARLVGALLVMLTHWLPLTGWAQGQRALPAYFQEDAAARTAADASPLARALLSARSLTLDAAALRAALAPAPLESQAGLAPLVLVLPLPDGGTARFAVREAPVMAPALAAQFPAIKTYAGLGLDDPSASVRLDFTPQGFHAQVLTGGGKSFYIDPVTRTDTRHYFAFYQVDMNRAAAVAGPAMTCGFQPTQAEQAASAARVAAAGTAAQTLASGSQLRTYRLAVAATGEYTAFHGGTVAAAQAAIVTTVNRVVGVYEKELAVRLVLVPNNSSLIYTDAATDPYANTSNDLAANQTNVDAIIGSANYDIGHLVGTGGGGIAGLGVVCSGTRKAQGLTGSPSPVGDAFDIDYVAHEMGHQFSGNHPFNGNASNCAGGNRNASTAYEPGSGSTIMAYAGICGSVNDLQPHSDPTFHTGNYQEMRAFIDGTTCSTSSATGNTAPVVTAPASGKTLPISTPFKLTATATDAENDALTYMWEELDLGPQQAPNTTQVANRNVPLFRSFVPLTSGTRYFPRLSDLVNNTTVLGERLPTVTRSLNFRCTARDEHSGPAGVIGGVDYSSTVNMAVTSTAGPFVVTSPNTALTWLAGAAQTVTWDVANTTAAPVSCATVNILLSLDGGLTYPNVLATGVPNNGRAVVVFPNTATSTARLLVEAADNYFFDISDTNFNLVVTPRPSITSFSPGGGLPGTVVTIRGGNLSGATSVTFNGRAAASFVVNSSTEITATVPSGASTGFIIVTVPAGTANSSQRFFIGSPPVVTSFTPTSGGAGTNVVLTGTGFTATTAVTFGGVNAPVFNIDSDTQITVRVPAGALTGPIAVTTPIGTGTSVAAFVVLPTPIITSFAPTAGPPGIAVVLTGSVFTGVTLVSFSGTNAPDFTVDSDTQITVTVPAGALTGPITVTGPNGQTTSAQSFTVNDIYLFNNNSSATTCSGMLYDSGGPNTGSGGGTYGNNQDFTKTFTPATAGAKLRLVFLGQDFYLLGGDFLYIYDGVNTSAPLIGQYTGRSPGTVNATNAAGQLTLRFVSDGNGTANGFAATISCVLPPAPAITSFTPTYGPVGSTVTITGTNLGYASSVSFNGTAQTTFISNSATEIVLLVPAGATSGLLTVTTAGGTSAASSQSFTVTPPAPPVLTSFTPTSGPTGTSVALTGTSLGNPTTVRVNGTAGTVLGTPAPTSTSFSFAVGAGSTTGAVTLATAGGVATSTLAPVLRLQAAGAGIPDRTVFFDQVELLNATSGTIVSGGIANGSFETGVPAGDIAYAPTTVTPWTFVSAGGIAAVSTTNSFYAPPPPPGGSAHVAVLQAAGAYVEQPLSLAAGTYRVRFQLAQRQCCGAYDLGVQVSINGVPLGMVLTNPNANYALVESIPFSVSNAGVFTVIAPPAIATTGLNPTSGPVGTSITITGTNLSGASSVRFNGTAQTTITANTATSLTVVVPAGATTGTVTVTTPGGTSAPSAQVFTVVCPAPVATAQDVSAPLDATGTATVTAAQVNNGSTANCGPAAAGTLRLQRYATATLSGEVNEGGTLTLTAPNGGVFTAITFASYGTPTGAAGSYASSGCNAATSVSVVSTALLGNNSGSIAATNATFGDPCGGTMKKLAVTATYEYYAATAASTTALTYTCAEAGPHYVQLTVTDAGGTTSTARAKVTVSVPATPTTTWLGGSADWTACSNWSFGKVPDAATSAVIPAGRATYPSLPTGTYPVNALTIDAGGSLTVTSEATLQVNGNFANSGTATLSGTVAFVGSAATQTLSNASGFTTLVVNKASGTVQLAQNLTINSGLALSSGTLTTTTSYQVNLGGSATISESDASYVLGKVVVNRPLASGAAESFAGLGLVLTPAAGSPAPGATLVTRTTGTAISGAGTSQSILRNFNIVPTVKTGLNVTMDFAYLDHERNGIPVANLTLFKSASGGTPWIPQLGTTAAGSVITKTGITDFSVWTLGNSAAPLPVELAAFTAKAEGNTAVRLAWATASEKNSQSFEVERSLDGVAFARIGTVAAAGSSTTALTYALLDDKLPKGTSLLYYRLRQVDLDGTSSYSPVRSVSLTGVAAGLALFPNPAHSAVTLTGAQPGAVVAVLDALGRQVTSAMADAVGTAALTLPVRLAAGMYVVRAGSKSLRLTVE